MPEKACLPQSIYSTYPLKILFIFLFIFVLQKDKKQAGPNRPARLLILKYY